MIPDGQWRQYHSVFNIQEEANEDSVTVGKINSIKYYITGPGAGVDIYLDGVQFNYYERDRSWVPGANLRINELRTSVGLDSICTQSGQSLNGELRILIKTESSPFEP